MKIFQIAAMLLMTFPLFSQNKNTGVFDWQGHRGCRGLMSENSIPAFLKALEYPVTTLELDLAVSKDYMLIVSHEPWMSEHICSKPDGTPVLESEAKSLKIMGLNYEDIKKYDCGSRGNPRFPKQEKIKTYKPSLAEVVIAVREECQKKGREFPRFNIEIKSAPEGDGVFTPSPEDFARMVLSELERLNIKELCTVQSFDVRPLQVLKKLDQTLVLALLVENEEGPAANIAKLGFTPAIYSPYYELLNKKTIQSLHEQGIKVIPWTVNDKKTMKKLKRWKVDGIITDYPDLIPMKRK